MDWEKILYGLGTASLPVITILIKMWVDKVKAKQEAKKVAARIETESSTEFIINVNREITHETKKIRDRHEAMRVYVIHFSNGTVTEANLHLLKITFMHEVVVDWTERRIEAVSKFFKEAHMPEMFLSSMNNLVRTGEFYLKDRETLNMKDVHTKDYHDWLKAYGVMSTLWLPIRSDTGKLLAVLVCHWPAKTDLDGTVIAKIKDINRTIESIYDRYKPL